MGIHEHRTCAWQSVVMPLALSGMDRVVKTKIESELNTDTRERDGERERGPHTNPQKKSCLFSSKSKKKCTCLIFLFEVGIDGCPDTLEGVCPPFMSLKISA